ncbi:DUF6364 family protein [Parabacteroides distasonis]|uniref:Uncharacterized protein n=1 Tax=Parabacteroides distasonis TaxID=823 RepID=A0A5C6KG45_PARDI|nr:DUF6364 family protein [Parabacteroides distasonis]TWV61366.1 hypothetical protein FSA05_12085 [Parabacteroides distasonis]
MDGNLILKINDSVLRKALDFANRKGMDLSVVVEEFLSRFASGTSSEVKDIVISDKVKELVGILSSTGDEDWKKDKANYLAEKYK